MRIGYLPPARDELFRAARFYALQAPGLNATFLSAIRSTESMILAFPQAAPRIRGEIRRALVDKFPYSILYAVRGRLIVVIAVIRRRG